MHPTTLIGRLTLLVVTYGLLACNSIDVKARRLGYFTGHYPRSPQGYLEQYSIGERAAKSDLAAGVLAWEELNNGESAAWRILWCFRKVLANTYGIQYRLVGHNSLYDNEGRARGYQSVANSTISAKLGSDWYERIYQEAVSYYHKHWPEIEAQCNLDESSLDDSYLSFVRRNPKRPKAYRAAFPLDYYYGYRDLKSSRKWVPPSLAAM